MYPPPHACAPAPVPVPEPPRRWCQHPALIITALVVLPPVKAAGAAPIRRGDPGYGRHLDRDGVGVGAGCER
ncbi:excalibur calcium-binding domain-containing protein [Streptomyces virginiae]|uniref:excalibur calcium-binding domain-containing protein n=1 Tax=Streptomyces virginiae TaxID=1961 RepID=UPI003F541755